MVQITRKFITKSKFMLASAVFALAFSVLGVTTVLQTQSASAQTAAQECDEWNIVRCGLTGTNLAGYISSFKSLYTSGTDNGNDDLKTVFQWAGATDANVAAMSTSNTKLGTLYKNGEIKVDGKVVGTDAWVTGRYSSQREGFVHVTTNVYARATTNPFYTHDTAPVIVHFGANGAADYAVMTGCGNSVKFTPTPPPTPPQPPVVTCDSLTATKSNTLRTYRFTAKATAKRTKIVSYDFFYSDNKKETVTTDATSASTTHTFPENDTTYSIAVLVNTTDVKGVSDDRCRIIVKTPKVETPPVLACTSLTYKHVKGEPLTYRFTAKATAKNVDVITYTFHFGDDTTKVVKSDALSVEAMHTYAENNQTYVAYVTVSDGNANNPKTVNACRVTIKTPKVDECKPGVPVGSPECEEETPIPPTTPPTPTPPAPEEPTELPAAGAAGVVGLFGATTALGTLLHRFILRRRLGL